MVSWQGLSCLFLYKNPWEFFWSISLERILVCASIIYYNYYYFNLWEFSHQPMVSHLSFRDSKSPQVFRTLFNILADPTKAVAYDVLNSSSYFQVLESLFQFFGDCTKSSNYYWYYRHFLFPFFYISWKGPAVVFWPSTRPKMPFQGDAPEGSDTF